MDIRHSLSVLAQEYASKSKRTTASHFFAEVDGQTIKISEETCWKMVDDHGWVILRADDVLVRICPRKQVGKHKPERASRIACMHWTDAEPM